MAQTNRELESRLGIRGVMLLFVAAIVLFLFYTVIFSASAKNADCVNGYLIGLDMGAGNWRLAHWHLVVDTFWFQDALAYALATRLLGNRPFLMVIVPALAWSGVVVFSWLLARRHRPQGDLLWASLIVAAVLALPVLRDNPIMVFITVGTDHIVTLLECLAVFLLLERFRHRGGIGTLAFAFLLTTAAVAGDPLTTFITVLPVAGASLLCNDMAPGRRAMILVSVVAAAILGHELVAVNMAHGGFQLVNRLDTSFSPIEQVGRNLRFTVQALLGFWGADFFGLSKNAALPHLLRLPLLGLTIWLAVVACRRVSGAVLEIRTATLGFLDCALLFGALIVITACVLSTIMVDFWAGRYLLPAVVYLVILTARQTPPFRARSMIGGLALAGSLLAFNGYHLTLHPTLHLRGGVSELSHWLEQQKLDFGYAQYWTASPITVASRGKVQALALSANQGKVVPFVWITRDDWYPARLDARRPFFVIIDPAGTSPSGAFSRADAEAVFGMPSETAKVAGFFVEIYR